MKRIYHIPAALQNSSMLQQWSLKVGHRNSHPMFRVTGHFAGNSPVPDEFPAQSPVTRSFDLFFDLRPNKRFSKQSWGWWFEMPSRPLWRHRNVILQLVSAFLYFLLWIYVKSDTHTAHKKLTNTSTSMEAGVNIKFKADISRI